MDLHEDGNMHGPDFSEDAQRPSEEQRDERLDCLVKCRATTVLLAAKMLKQLADLADYGDRRVKPMREVAGELLQMITDQMAEKDIASTIVEAKERERT